MTANRPRSAAERAEYRRFIRQHHPDVGGDAATFAAGLRRYRQAPQPGGSAAERCDAPIVVISERERFRRSVRLLWRRLRRRRRLGPVRVR